ncbi:MAG: hypothetical protein U1E76_02845 [Planctomycetota bacterium]
MDPAQRSARRRRLAVELDQPALPVGYRPLTAVSYAFDTWRGKLEPAAYHQTDLALHLALVALAYLIGAQLLGRPLGVIAAIIVGIDPVGAHVVPVLARRGDLLVAVFSAIALLAALRGRAVASSLAAALAFASKEVAIVLPPVLALAALLHAPERDARARALRLGGGALFAIAALAVVRVLILGQVGGYPAAERPAMLRIAAEFVTNLWLPGAQLVTTPGRDAEWRSVFLIVAIACMVSACLALARHDVRRDARVAGAIGLAWLVLQLALWLVTRTFFARLLYPALLPLALIVCAALRGARVPFGVLPAGVTLLALLSGPLLRGLPEWRAASDYQRRAIAALESGLAADDWVVGVVNYPIGVRFDAAARATRFGALPVQSEADQTEILGPTHLGAWTTARLRRSRPERPSACIACHDARVFPLNGILFDAPEVTIPLRSEPQAGQLRVTLGRASYRSFRMRGFFDRGELRDAPDQPFAVTRQQLHVPRGAKLLVSNGQGGELRPFPDQFEIEFER